MWFTLSIANMLVMTLLRLLQKAFVTKNRGMNPLRINWLVFLSTVPVAVFILAHNTHTLTLLPSTFWLTLVAVVVGFYPLVNYLFFAVIRTNELSNVLPLLALIPILTMFSGWILLNQHPGYLALAGVFCIAASIYSLEVHHRQSWFEPFSELFHSRAAVAMATVSVITAFAAIGDKFAIERSTASIYFALNSLGAVAVLMIGDLIITRRNRLSVRRELALLSPGEWKILIALALTQLITQVSGFAAINAAANTGYTIAIKNLNIVLASLVAVAIYRESVNRFKLLSYGLSALGVVMIAL